MTAVSVLMPVSGDGKGLEVAAGCILAQTLRDIEVLLLANGATARCRDVAGAIARSDKRVRVVDIEERGLAKALNTGMTLARHDLVARMDADDECRPERLGRQRDFMHAHPEITVLGTAFEGIETTAAGAGEVIGVEHPPSDPAELRWRLLLGNLICHGSVMMHREAVLKAGGYDTTVEKAQDYDLWLRLARTGHKLANLPDVLYRYSTSRFKRDRTQASFAAAAMTGAWSQLPGASDDVRKAIEVSVGAATWGGSDSRRALASVEALLTREGPTREGLMAWWWCAQRAGRVGLPLEETVRLTRVREAGERLRHAGVPAVWLYGAGRHTRWLLENLDELGVTVCGVIDDSRAGERVGDSTVASPDITKAGEHVLISSDAQERSIWEKCIALRARAVRVHRIYGHEQSSEARVAA